MKLQEYSLSDWIDEKVMRGYYTFTIGDIKKNFPQFGAAYKQIFNHIEQRISPIIGANH